VIAGEKKITSLAQMKKNGQLPALSVMNSTRGSSMRTYLSVDEPSPVELNPYSNHFKVGNGCGAYSHSLQKYVAAGQSVIK
jgi:hypothetical protein